MPSSLPALPRWLLMAIAGIALGGIFAFIYLRGLALVPFHPDESSFLFMSRDFDTLFLRRDPAALAYRPDQPLTRAVTLSLLNAPIARYLAGLGWWMHGITVDDLNEDWVWGATWEANQRAIPRPEILLAARVPTTLLGAFTVTLLFWFGTRLGGWPTGLIAALLIGFEPLMLLHARRAMAESALSFFSALAAVGSLALTNLCDRLEKLSWRITLAALLVGGTVGLAMCSKQTEIVTLPMALLASGVAVAQRRWPARQRLTLVIAVWAAIGLGSGLTFWFLNPVLSQHPVLAGQEMLRLRSELARSQIQSNGARDPASVLSTVPARLQAMLQQLYWAPPAVWDAPVYVDQLQPGADAYFAESFHTWLRQPPAPVVLLGLSALGIVVCLRYMRGQGANVRAMQVLGWWFGITLVMLALVIPLNWQRYFMPLLAPTRLFAALGAGVALAWGWAAIHRKWIR